MANQNNDMGHSFVERTTMKDNFSNSAQRISQSFFVRQKSSGKAGSEVTYCPY